jgi:hypothetical protein
VGIENVNAENNALNIYHNPTNSNFTITSNQLIKTITIYDVIGQQVLNQSVNKLLVSINVEGLPNGLYFLKAIDEKENSITKKIVKE